MLKSLASLPKNISIYLLINRSWLRICIAWTLTRSWLLFDDDGGDDKGDEGGGDDKGDEGDSSLKPIVIGKLSKGCETNIFTSSIAAAGDASSVPSHFILLG